MAEPRAHPLPLRPVDWLNRHDFPPRDPRQQHSGELPPSRSGGFHFIDDIAIGPQGQIAILVSASPAVLLLNSSDQFSSVPTPRQSESSSVTFTSDGRLVIGLADYLTHHYDQVEVSNLSSGTNQVLPVRYFRQVATDGAVGFVAGTMNPTW